MLYIARERFKFWSDMRRKPGETVQELAARICQDSVTCDFPSIHDPLDEALRTRFMCSISNEAVLKSLFKIKDNELTFARAIAVAVQTEETAKVAKEMVYGSKPSSIHQIQTPQRQKQQGQKGHTPRDFPKGTCSRCGTKRSNALIRIQRAISVTKLAIFSQYVYKRKGISSR